MASPGMLPVTTTIRLVPTRVRRTPFPRYVVGPKPKRRAELGLLIFGDLLTVVQENLPIKIVVLNNFGDGMVKQWQKLFFKGRLSASDRSLHKKDFVKAAQADGFGYAVRLDRGCRRLSDGRPRSDLHPDDHGRLHCLAPRG